MPPVGRSHPGRQRPQRPGKDERRAHVHGDHSVGTQLPRRPHGHRVVQAAVNQSAAVQQDRAADERRPDAGLHRPANVARAQDHRLPAPHVQGHSGKGHRQFPEVQPPAGLPEPAAHPTPAG